MEKIRVLCVDDHEATTSFYRLALDLEPDMEFVGSRRSTEGLLQAVEATRPSVLLLDLLIPGCDSLQALAEIRSHFPSLVILVASGLDEGDVVEEVFRRGGSGFFLKSLDLSDLVTMIRRAAAGERVNTGPTPSRSSSTWKLPGARPNP